MTATSIATADATPRPIYRVLVIICVLVIIALLMLGGVLALTYRGTATSNDLAIQGRRRDCVTTISAARNAVFTNVALYTSVSTQLLNGALLDSANGVTHTQAEKDAIKAIYDTNNGLLTAANVEARRLQPAGVLDRLIAHGGVVDGVQYERCPG